MSIYLLLLNLYQHLYDNNFYIVLNFWKLLWNIMLMVCKLLSILREGWNRILFLCNLGEFCSCNCLVIIISFISIVLCVIRERLLIIMAEFFRNYVIRFISADNRKAMWINYLNLTLCQSNQICMTQLSKADH